MIRSRDAYPPDEPPFGKERNRKSHPMRNHNAHVVLWTIVQDNRKRSAAVSRAPITATLKELEAAILAAVPVS